MPVFPASAGAAMEPLLVVFEGDGTWLPVGVSLDGVDLIIGSSTQILFTAIDVPLAAVGLVTTLKSTRLGCIASTGSQKQGQLVP